MSGPRPEPNLELRMYTLLCSDLSSEEVSYEHIKEAQRHLTASLREEHEYTTATSPSATDHHTYQVSLGYYCKYNVKGPRIFTSRTHTRYELVACIFLRLEDMQNCMPDIQRIAATQKQLGIATPKLYVLNEKCWKTWVLKTGE